MNSDFELETTGLTQGSRDKERKKQKTTGITVEELHENPET
jgi:hypothetical protein